MIYSSKTDALQIQQQNEFVELSETMQHFISQIAAGHTQMANLINWDGVRTRQQIQQSEIGMKDLINAHHVEEDIKVKRKRLLQSLKFESMNARRTDIKIASEATYVSFFKSLEFAKKPTSGSAAAAWADFVDWLQSDEQTFWIQGKPGAGKSTLVKFLLQHENTHKALDKWNHDSVIISHFFWKPGNILQRNLRGLLCSLSHQLLSSQPGLIDRIISEFKFTKENDSIGDWEISHLVAIFKYILAHYNRPIFFLIDGVDEAADAEEIIKFLISSITLQNTKWCISSRGEQIFQQAFSKYKGFKLNEYTRDDMLDFARKEIQYALANVQEYETIYTEQFLEKLQRVLVDKAEGVYLWLVLALESIKRGFRNHDGEDIILSRLRKLPTGLEELYADMWNRLGEDKDIYRGDAVRYFKLLITHRTLSEEYQKQYETLDHGSTWFLTPFQTMLSQDEDIQRSLLDESYELQLSDLGAKYSGMTNTISIKTAGLLVTQDTPKSLWLDLQIRTEYSQLEKHATSKIDFIHRTLFDFLRDTEPGRNILLGAKADHVPIQLATTMLCQLRIMKTTDKTRHPRRTALHLHYLRWLLKQARTDDNDRLFNTLLPAYERLFEARLIPWDQRSNIYPRPCFDTLLLSDPTFQPFIKGRLKSKGASYATRVLREYMFAENVYSSRRPDLGVNIPEFFHDLGADINSAGACFYEPPVSIGQFAGCFTYESALSEFVKQLHSYNRIRRFYTRSPGRLGFNERLRCLVAFLETSPDLDTRTCCLWRSNNSSTNGNLRLLLSALSVDNNKYDSMSRSSFSHERKIIISEANLRYLIENFLKSFSSSVTETMNLVTRALQLVRRTDSKPYFKARFIVSMQTAEIAPLAGSVTLYQVVDEDADVSSEPVIRKITSGDVRESYPTLCISSKKVDDYLGMCKEVDVSALSVLLDQKLGACFLES